MLKLCNYHYYLSTELLYRLWVINIALVAQQYVIFCMFRRFKSSAMKRFKILYLYMHDSIYMYIFHRFYKKKILPQLGLFIKNKNLLLLKTYKPIYLEEKRTNQFTKKKLNHWHFLGSSWEKEMGIYMFLKLLKENGALSSICFKFFKCNRYKSKITKKNIFR